MKKKTLLVLSILTLSVYALTGCGKDISAIDKSEVSGYTEVTNNDESTKEDVINKQPETIIEVVEEATTTKEDDGTIVVETASGEELKVKPTDKKETNADGTVTYTTEEGKKVTVNEKTGDTTVSSEVSVPVDSEEKSEETKKEEITPKKTPEKETHKCSYSVSEKKDATCTEKGKVVYTCSCGKSYSNDVDVKPHTAGNWTVVKTATCNEDGKEIRKCTVCGKETDTKVVTKLNHTAGNWETVKASSCTEEGKEVKKCATCSKEMDSRTVAKTSHSVGNWTVTKAATCKTEGKEVKKCNTCGIETESRAIAKSSHTPGDWVVTKAATETATGEKVKKCTVCGVTTETATINKLAHSHNYSWDTNENTRTMKCSCGAKGITEEYYNGVWGYFDRAAAENLYYWVNASRAQTQYGVTDVFGNPIGVETVPALTGFDSLYETAKQRATDIVKNYSHDGMKTDNENLAGGAPNAQACYEAWCYSSTHARTLSNQIYKTGSCAVFYYDSDNSGTNLYPYYVLIVNK